MAEARHPNCTPYNRLIYEMIDAWLDRHRALVRGALIDLGCGEMPYRERFLRDCDSYTGVDWANSLHEVRADISTDLDRGLPIPEQSADTVTLLSVLEHLREPQALLDEAFRILKPGGSLLLQVPFMWPVHEAPHDYFRFTEYGLRHLLGKAGFSAIVIENEGGYWTLAALRLNYQSARLIRGPRPVRWFAAACLRLLWAADQRLAPALDRIWRADAETVGYLVSARKK
jgi:SAM-dependent methyltransferase